MSGEASLRIILLDTDTASKLQIGKLRQDYLEILGAYDLRAISWITEAEWLVGLNMKPNEMRRKRFDEWMAKTLRLPHDDEITRRYGDLAAIAMQRRSNTKHKQNDVWIAATAVRHNIPLMTLNRGDYQVLAEYGGLRLEPPLGP